MQYTDDTILFGRVNIEEVVIRKWVLHTFEKWSGLKINYEKSNIIFMGEMKLDNLIVEKILGCRRDEFPIKYLGVSLRDTK